jgi:hypothetical protein
MPADFISVEVDWRSSHRDVGTAKRTKTSSLGTRVNPENELELVMARQILAPIAFEIGSIPILVLIFGGSWPFTPGLDDSYNHGKNSVDT